MPDESIESTFKSLTPNTSAIREYLFSHDYIVTGTDKNLGIAVSKRTWIVDMSWDILNNPIDYEEISKERCTLILRQKSEQMDKLAEVASLFDVTEGSLSEYLRSKTPDWANMRGDPHVPKFYGIPKIHKQPVKFRPIIPCHSVVMNPAAKLISKKLKPIINSAPAIIHGTKDLAIKLSKLKLQPGRKFFIVTGDVVAFYPNIDLDKCLNIALEELVEYYVFGGRVSHVFLGREKTSEYWISIFKKALHVGNTQLVTQFLGRYFLQKRGLAMGVADSPDLANIYGLYFEKKCGILSNPLVPYYGRYIDDCLAIVYAETATEALSTLGVVQFDNCVIEWNASEFGAPFLDMFLYRDEVGKLQHHPYRKAQSHQERIPWISHHPLDVKRGTFVGEMSRLATLSSTRQHYWDAIQGLVALYIARGYPESCIKSWTQKNLTERWEKRLREPSLEEQSRHGDVLVLKSEFNTAWNYFNAKELGETVTKYWAEWLERAARGDYTVDFPSCDEDGWGAGETYAPAPTRREPDRRVPDVRKSKTFTARWLVSRKRTTNLMDLASLWKKTVLGKLEEKIVEEFDSTLR